MKIERLRQVVGVVGILLLEGCKPTPFPQEQLAQVFVNTLTSGNTSGAISLFPREIQADPGLKQYIESIARQVGGCEIGKVVMEEETGRLLGLEGQVRVFFQRPCGQGEGDKFKDLEFSSMSVGFKKIEGIYYVTPVGTTPVPAVNFPQ